MRRWRLDDVLLLAAVVLVIVAALWMLSSCDLGDREPRLDVLVPVPVIATWEPPRLSDGTPDPDLSGYRVYLNGEALRDTPDTRAQFEALVGDRVYVTAFDAARNESAPSETVTVR